MGSRHDAGSTVGIWGGLKADPHLTGFVFLLVGFQPCRVGTVVVSSHEPSGFTIRLLRKIWVR